jgi:hypothetical protein
MDWIETPFWGAFLGAVAATAIITLVALAQEKVHLYRVRRLRDGLLKMGARRIDPILRENRRE